MRLRATRAAVTIKGQGYRHGKEITRNVVSGFLFSGFFKSEKATRCRTESCIPRPRRARWWDDWMQGCAPCTAVVFLLAQKDDGTAQAAFSCRFAAIHLELRQAFPLHSLRSASAVTLLLLKLLIVHSRIVPASVFAPQGAHAKQGC